MSTKFIKADLNILNMKARMPFKYGIATLTALPHLFVRLEMQIDDESSTGLASEGLAPKWFTKNPDSSFEDDISEMLMVIKKAVCIAEEINDAPDVFSFWREMYDRLHTWGKSQELPSLLTSLGSSLIERAIISAYCNAKGKPFHKLLRDGSLGFKVNTIYSELNNSAITCSLPQTPANAISIRHTVGLADPLTPDDIRHDELVQDELPQSFQENIEVYEINKLKIKLFGEVKKDSIRLSKIKQIMNGRNYSFTLDGNEFFKTALEFRKYWQELIKLAELGDFFKKLLFVEQPIHRDFALNEETGQCFLNWPDKPKLIIDESDSDLHSAQNALSLGYSGTSHKNCKGVFKSIANACLMKKHSGTLSAEDLCNIGPIALQEDLAIAAALGIQHIERNGHQYMRGLSMYPKAIQEQVLEYHGDLYKEHEGFPTLNISNGKINLKSINESPFGVQNNIDTLQFTPLDQWNFKDLNLS